MKTMLLKNKIFPLMTAIMVGILFILPLGFGDLTNIVATLITILSSFVSFRKDAFKSLGLSNFKDQRRDFFIYAPLLAITLFGFYVFVLLPVVTYLTGLPIDFSVFKKFEGDLPACAVILLFIWVSAAFGEEIIWKGFLMRHFVRIFGDGTLAIVINIALFGALFGYVHAYQGITGQIVAAIIGMVLGFIFYKRKYNLWFNIAVHGFFDTIAVICMYYGFL